jgi:hypothetical protein
MDARILYHASRYLRSGRSQLESLRPNLREGLEMCRHTSIKLRCRCTCRHERLLCTDLAVGYDLAVGHATAAKACSKHGVQLWHRRCRCGRPTNQTCSCSRNQHRFHLVSSVHAKRTWKPSLTLDRVGFWVYFWTMLEWNLAIICNCAPSMRAFFREYLKDTVDKALNSLSSRSKYKSTTKGSLASQQNIELKRTYTVESKFNDHGSIVSKDGSVSPVSLQQLASLPQVHPKYSDRNNFSRVRRASQFVPNDSAWSDSETNITYAGPGHVKGPYGEV